MTVKRLGVLVASLVLGALATFVLLQLIRLMQSNVTVAYYGYDYFALTSIFIGAAVLVWLDNFMKTGILPR